MPAEQASPVFELVEYERRWVEALNRGDVSGADDAFAPDCVIHITGGPVPGPGSRRLQADDGQLGFE
jgi:hypothetical protein